MGICEFYACLFHELESHTNIDTTGIQEKLGQALPEFIGALLVILVKTGRYFSAKNLGKTSVLIECDNDNDLLLFQTNSLLI